MNIIYKQIRKEELVPSLFKDFNRHQEVHKCWRKEKGKWVLKDISFTEDWGDKELGVLTDCLINTVETGGVVFGAYSDNSLVGFASLESCFFGSHRQYLQLSSIHVSTEARSFGIGKELFKLICENAVLKGAKKLYISAHSSEESQAFYKALGCVEAEEYNRVLADKEPCDCQLEFIL